MLNTKDRGRSIAKIKYSNKNCKILSISEDTEPHKGDLPGGILVKEGNIEPVPSMLFEDDKVKPTREIIYVAGPSGSGKSYWTASYIKNFNKLFPKKKVYVFSRLTEDPVLDKLKIIRIESDEDLVENPVNIHDEVDEGCLFVFDDCDTITNEQVKNAVTALMIDILETGRHRNIYCLITSHLLQKPKREENNRIYNEIHRLVIFPKSGNRTQKIRVLENQLGLDKKKISEILNIKSRWVCIGKNYPMYMFWDKGAQLL